MKLINAGNAPAAVGGYSQATLIEQWDQLLFVSGQIPESQNGHVPLDFEDQCRLTWANLEAQLKAAGMSVSNLVKVTIFLSSRDYADANSRIRREILQDHEPAITVIISGIFDERWLLEIEAIAAA